MTGWAWESVKRNSVYRTNYLQWTLRSKRSSLQMFTMYPPKTSSLDHHVFISCWAFEIQLTRSSINLSTWWNFPSLQFFIFCPVTKAFTFSVNEATVNVFVRKRTWLSEGCQMGTLTESGRIRTSVLKVKMPRCRPQPIILVKNLRPPDLHRHAPNFVIVSQHSKDKYIVCSRQIIIKSQ